METKDKSKEKHKKILKEMILIAIKKKKIRKMILINI